MVDAKTSSFPQFPGSKLLPVIKLHQVQTKIQVPVESPNHAGKAAVPQVKELPGGCTTIKQLLDVLKKKPKMKFRIFQESLNLLNRFDQLFTNQDLHEVYPRIWIGNGLTATNKEYLIKKKITHVLNAAAGRSFGNIETNADYYKEEEIKYIGFDLRDSRKENISQHFEAAAAFIHNAVSNNGRVFVHCRAGVSRSVTLVIAYLMLKKGMAAAEALRQVKLIRSIIRPNSGFLGQLAVLDNQLRRQRV